MSSETVNQFVDRLIQAAPLSAERFAALLVAPLQPGSADSKMTTYTFELPQGPFAGGELRLHAGGDWALLILQSRGSPGLGQADVDRKSWGRRLSMQPNPNVPPEGTFTEIFQKDGVQVALEWTATTRRLLSLVLEWPSPHTGASPHIRAAPNAGTAPPAGANA